MKISSETVRHDFNDPIAVVHYARAAHFLGLWKSEKILIERFFPERSLPVLEAGCGAGRVTLGLWELGFRQLTAFDFADALLDQARSLAQARGADGIHFLNADATRLGDIFPSAEERADSPSAGFSAAFFMFNGLMQIPGRRHRRTALREICRVCRRGARFLFTTHDRNASSKEIRAWKEEAARWRAGEQDPRLVEFGDRYFSDESGRTFMHLPDRPEILEDLEATGWDLVFDSLRSAVVRETRAVLEFSDECRFWVAQKK